MNFGEWVCRHAAARPTAVALARGEDPHADWLNFAARMAGLGGWLSSTLRCRPGERAAVVMRNRCEYLEALFGIWHAGLVAVPVNARLHSDEIAWILDHSGVSVIFTDETLVGTVGGLDQQLERLRTVVVAGSAEWRASIGGPAGQMVHRHPEDPAWLFYTSGTTGRPKGATLTHRNLLMMSLSYFADIDWISADDAIVHAAPLSHGSGLYGLPHIARGAASVVPESGGVDPAEIAALLGRWSGVSLFAAPTIVTRLVAEPAMRTAALENLKTIVYGGAPMYLADLEDALSVFGRRLAQIYGQGESPMTITALGKDDHVKRQEDSGTVLTTVGRPRTDVEVRVVGADGEPVAAGEPGEVVVRGDVVMAGYWENPAATAEALRGGWLHTGDIGSFDHRGYLTLLDRSKDVIISGGTNIYPREVEEVLLRHPDVREVCVLGAPDREWGEHVVAFVVATDPGNPPAAEQLDGLCLNHIARFKRPREYRFVSELPKNNYGKVLKRELREALDNRGHHKPTIDNPSHTASAPVR